MRTRRGHGTRPVLVLGAVLLVAALVAAGCGDDTSSGDDAGPDDSNPDATGEAAPLSADFDPSAVGELTIAAPPVEGAGATILGPGGLDLTALGYEQEELFVSGTASTYLSEQPLAEDGEWTVTPDAEAAFTTRVVVRRPADAADFNGNVIVEWLNVSGGLDADPDWVYAHDELIREGWAWIGVSAQARGIEGGGGPGAILALKPADPERYGPLVHPGDDFSYDMYSQVGAAVRTQPEALLGDLEPERVLAIGESQSAFRLTTYVNAIAPLAAVYDGYVIHARSDSAADLNAEASPPQEAPSPTFVRTDLDVPVLIFSSETDLLGLEYALARQDDTDLIRGWEVAGTSHADAYNLGIGDTDDGSGAGDTALFESMLEPPDSIYGGVIACDLPINAGPQTYVLRAAVHALDSWVRTGEAPPGMPRLEIDEAGTAFVTDEVGNAVGGIRTPQVDAPVAVLSGLGQDGEGFCGLFGTTVPLDAAALAEAYPDHDAFVAAWNESIDAAVEAGVILEPDADHLRSVAEQSTIAT
jgi:hypothetical protein